MFWPETKAWDSGRDMMSPMSARASCRGMGVLERTGAGSSAPGPKTAAPFSQRKQTSSATGAKSCRMEWYCRPEAGQNSTPAERRRRIRSKRAEGRAVSP